MDEEPFFNVDDNHLVVYLIDFLTLAIKGDEEVKFCDVVSINLFNLGSNIMDSLGIGSKYSMFVPFIILYNQHIFFPILLLPYKVPGVTYRMGSDG